MATPQMGQFTYEMVLQFAKFQDALNKQPKAIADAGEKIRKSLESVADSVTDKFKEVAVAIGIGLSIDKLVELGKAAADQADKINNLAKVVGVSTQTLQAYTFAADLTGGSIDTVSESVTHLSKTMSDAQAGNKQMLANFNAIGISGSQLAQLLKNPDKALTVIAQHFAEYSNSYDKAAIAQQIFGRSGAELLPFLTKIGTGFGEVTAQAQAFGLVLSDADQKALTGFKESSDLVGEQIKGLATQFMVGLSPALKQINESFSAVISPDLAKQWGANIGAAVSTAIDWLGNMRTGFGEIAGYIDQFWIKVKTGAEADIAYLGFAWDSFVAATKNSFVDLYGYALKAANLLQNGPLAAQGTNPLIDEKLAGMKSAAPSIDALNKKIADLQKNMDLEIAASNMAIDSADGWAAGLKRAGDAAEETGTKTAKLPGDVNALAAAYRKYADDLQAVGNLEDQLASGMEGPYLQALKQYQKGLDLLDKTWADATLAKKNDHVLWNRLVADSEKLGAQLDRTNAQIKQQHDLLTQQTNDLSNLIKVQGVAPDQQEALSAGLKKYDELMKSHFDFYGNYIEDTDKLTEELNKQLPLYVQGAQKLNDFNKAIALNQEAAKQWQSIWANAGGSIADTFSKILVEGGSLMDGLKSIAKQTVEAIISYFVKLSVINPILNAVFGGQTGFSVLPSLGNAVAGGVFGGGGGSSLVGSAFSSDSGSAIGSSGGSLFSGASWIAAGKNLATGFSSLWNGVPGGGSGSSILGGANYYTDSNGFMQGSSYAPNTFGNVVGIAGGLYAGYNEFKAAGGGAAGLVGGAAYGLGTITAAGAVGGVLSGAGAAAGAAGSLGAVGLGAIPIVGWIALAAMALNMITKGGLFGTSYSPTGNTGINVATDGSGINVGGTAEEKKKLPLFQGSKTRTISIDVPQSTIDALNKFFKTLSDGLTAYQKQFQKTGAAVLDSVFQQTFDKKGNVTSTTESIGGVKYQDTTAQDYEARLQALSFEKVITDMGISVSKFVDNTADAQTLLSQVQDVAGAVQEAQTNINAGFKFMALGADQTLKQVVDFVSGLANAGETLTQAYDRLSAAQQQYNQFVAQFVPAATYVDPFEQSISQLNQQMLGAMAQANALAKAAGAAGASQEDLTNIMNYYTKQMAAATAQLQQSAQALAFSLGLTTQGTLDQVNQEIATLEGSASGATQAVSSFGGAIKQVAQKASDAMNLLLGDLSPLNDQQKLQTALEGLRAGTVTADQVLQIGRRLYASSEQYTQLFNQVMATPKKGGGQQSAYGGGNPTSTTNLSPADQQKLKDLYAQRDTLQAAQTLGQFQTFVQEVAELATAKGEDFTQVLSDMGVKQSDIEKGLGLKDDAALRAYVEGYQKQIDSNGENTTSIVDAINALPAEIAAQLSSTGLKAGSSTPGPITVQPVNPKLGSTTPDPTAVSNAQTVTPIGTGVAVAQGGGASDQLPLSTQIANGVATGIAPVLARIDSSNRRNIRWSQNA